MITRIRIDGNGHTAGTCEQVMLGAAALIEKALGYSLMRGD